MGGGGGWGVIGLVCVCVCGRWGGLQRGEVQAFCLSPASHLGLLSVCVLLQPEPGKTYFQDLTLSCSLSVPLQLDPDKHIVEDERESAKSNVEYLGSIAFVLNEAQKCEKITFGKYFVSSIPNIYFSSGSYF